MSEIRKTKCDNQNCKNEVDNNAWDSATYHKLCLGGSDFQMSLGSPAFRELDFCCLECLKVWAEQQLEAVLNDEDGESE